MGDFKPYINGQYHKETKAEVKVWGNSAEIKKITQPINQEQRERLCHEEFTERREFINEIYDKAFEAHVARHGQEFEKHEFWYSSNRSKSKPPERKRGDITEFSNKSRYRLLKKINQLNPDDFARFLFVTLTYPSKYPLDGEEHKLDLDAFLKRCKRKFGAVIAYLWKLEFQKRGAPHYHIFFYIPEGYNIYYIRRWFSKNWYEVVQRFWETKLPEHHKAGTQVKQLSGLRQAGHYLSKYVAKKEGETPENQGRFWGNSRNWGEVVLNRVMLTGNQLIHFQRLVKRFLKGQYRMQKLITRPINLVVFGHWSFFTMAIDWVKKMH